MEAGGEVSERGRRMEERVLRSAAEIHVPVSGRELLRRALRAAMRPREQGPAALPSDQHPAFLHPGRTALILLGDLDETDPQVLAVGAMVESRDSGLRVDQETVLSLVGPGGLTVWRAVLDEDEEDLLERLVTSDPVVQRIVLAEALDHVRHVHLLADRDEQARAVLRVESVYGPLASRVHPVLDRRFDWWLRRVGYPLRRRAGVGSG
jgi:hypothetical protein